MLGWLITGLIFFSLICSIFTGKTPEVSASALESCTKAVELSIYLAGSMGLWGGLMRICRQSGITSLVSRVLRLPVNSLFKGIDNNQKAVDAVTMNLVANLFGLGNASTPLGIIAVKELSKTGAYSARNTAMLVVLNTASIQLIPTTVGAMRLAHGSQNPFDITLPIIAVSMLSAFAGCLTVYALYLPKRGKL